MNRLLPVLAVSLLSACGRAPEQAATEDVKSYIQKNLTELHASAVKLQRLAPPPDADGWNASSDAAAVEALRAEWKNARRAYEHVEGAIAVLFPELDVSTDERYDGFLELGPDSNLFDGSGVTGIHAAERILWSDSIPAPVKEFEQTLNGYLPAAFPANEAEARAFKEELLGRLVEETAQMEGEFGPLALDPAAAYRGVIGSMEEQLEKAQKAATGEEESRYAQHTLGDMRANIEGARATYQAFQPWLLTKKAGAELDREITAGLGRIERAYQELSGDSLPPVPSTWSSQTPSEADKETPFGRLFVLLSEETDPARDGSTVHAMNRSADELGIAQLPE